MEDKDSKADAARQRILRHPEAFSAISKDIQFLEDSELELIEFMIENDIWSGQPIIIPENLEGDLEFGLVPYLVHHPPNFIAEILDKDEAVKVIWNLVKLLLPTKLDAKDVEVLFHHLDSKKGLVTANGTIVGTATYEQFDLKWLWAFVNYLVVKHLDDRERPFPSQRVPPVVLEGSSADCVKIALVGDWGTGPSRPAAKQVMDQIAGLDPDYIIHLGDVYYSGTGGDFLPLNEEQDNFIDCLPSGFDGKCFTLNSNHEMYAGAKGYFPVALQDSRFAQQGKRSYFALQYAGLTLVGLDSAYFSPVPLFMEGSLDDPANPNKIQHDWIQELKQEHGLKPEKTIVLTHHTGLTYDGAAVTQYPKKGPPLVCLWHQVKEALGDDPAMWYWGHVHNGIVYTTPTVNNARTIARCLGHGALPFGQAWGLQTAVNVENYAQTLPKSKGKPEGNQVYNGFVLLTLSSDGTTVSEEFYQGDRHQPVWFSRKHHLG